MVLFRRRKPVWRSVIGPISLGLLWPSILGGFWFFLLSEFGNPLPAGASSPAPEATVQNTPEIVPGALAREGDLTHARILVAGQVVFEAELTHVGPLQVQSDRNLVAFDHMPTGSETAFLGQVQVFNLNDGQPVATFAGHSPAWNEEGQLAFRSADNLAYTFDLDTAQIAEAAVQPEADLYADEPLIDTQEIPSDFHPKTIRVRHHSQNHCRGDVPDNQVTEIPFEEYVARVLPAEVPPSWHIETLKAQAIVARTYAWRKIYQNRNGRYPFDISDWANHQMMCNYRHERTDLAAEATAGMVLSEQAQTAPLPILAMYSAENAHPTKKHSYLAYLDSVPDTNAIGKVRRGHGWGLSQLGAQRFAKQGLSFCQILGHYYSQIHINSFNAPDTPIGCLVINGATGFATGSGLHIKTIAAADLDSLTVEIRALPADEATVWTAYATEDGQNALSAPAGDDGEADTLVTQAETSEADPTPESGDVQEPPDSSTETPEAELSPVTEPDNEQESPVAEPVPASTATPVPGDEPEGDGDTGAPGENADAPDGEAEDTLAEPPSAWPVILEVSNGERLWALPQTLPSDTRLELRLVHGTQVLDTQTVVVDHRGPDRIGLSLLDTEVPDVLTVAMAGVAGDGISLGRDWTWEQSALHITPNAGAVAQDPAAGDGAVWYGDPDRHTSGLWYGPYTSVLPAAQSYRAIFRLRLGPSPTDLIEAAETARPVARLDVVHAQGTRTLGFRDIHLTDFRAAAGFMSFAVDFHLFEAVADLEFRTHWHGTHAMALDQVTVVSLPFRNWTDSTFAWPVVPDAPIRHLRVAAFDAADNMSTLFTLDLDAITQSQSFAFGETDCSLFGNCRNSALDLDIPVAPE